jgi:hypothetical protein
VRNIILNLGPHLMGGTSSIFEASLTSPDEGRSKPDPTCLIDNLNYLYEVGNSEIRILPLPVLCFFMVYRR